MAAVGVVAALGFGDVLGVADDGGAIEDQEGVLRGDEGAHEPDHLSAAVTQGGHEVAEVARGQVKAGHRLGEVGDVVEVLGVAHGAVADAADQGGGVEPLGVVGEVLFQRLEDVGGELAEGPCGAELLGIGLGVGRDAAGLAGDDALGRDASEVAEGDFADLAGLLVPAAGDALEVVVAADALDFGALLAEAGDFGGDGGHGWILLYMGWQPMYPATVRIPLQEENETVFSENGVASRGSGGVPRFDMGNP